MCVCAAKCCRLCMRVCVCCGMLLSNGWPKVTRRLLQHAMHGGREGGGGLAWLLAAGISYIDLLMSGMHYLPRPPPSTLSHSVFISSSTNVATLGVGGGGLLGLERGVAATTAVALF